MELACHSDDVIGSMVFRYGLVDEIIIAGFFKCPLEVVEPRAGGIFDTAAANPIAPPALDMFGGVQAVFQSSQAGDDLENRTRGIAFLCGSEQQGRRPVCKVMVPKHVTDARCKFIGVEYWGGNHGHHVPRIHLGYHGCSGLDADLPKPVFQSFHGGLLDFKIEGENHIASRLRGDWGAFSLTISAVVDFYGACAGLASEKGVEGFFETEFASIVRQTVVVIQLILLTPVVASQMTDKMSDIH